MYFHNIPIVYQFILTLETKYTEIIIKTSNVYDEKETKKNKQENHKKCATFILNNNNKNGN